MSLRNTISAGTAIVLLIVFLPMVFHMGLPSLNLVKGSTIPRLEVWSPDLHSSNITSLNLFPVGAHFKVLVNVTGAGPIQGFDLSLNYNLTVGPNVLQVVNATESGGLLDPNNPPSGCRIVIVKTSLDVPPGNIRFASVIVGPCTVSGTGTLLSMVFKVTGVGAGSIDIVRGNGNGLAGSTIVGPGPQGSVSISYVANNAYFRNQPGVPPIAAFTFTPSLPVVGETIHFNGTQSYDPDKPSAPNHGIKAEPVVYDTNGNGRYDSGEPVILGPSPAVGTVLKSDPNILYVDQNGNHHWDPGEPVVDDTSGTLTYRHDDVLISGAAPSVGTTLSSDPSIKYVDLHPNNFWDNGYVWDYGDGSPLSTGNVTSHVFTAGGTFPTAGIFPVKLVVFDADDNLSMRQISLVQVGRGIIHDVVVTLSLSNTVIRVGDPLNVGVGLVNTGSQSEVVDMNVTYSLNGGSLIASEQHDFIGIGARQAFTYTLQTGFLKPGVYTVIARVALLNTTAGGFIPYTNPQDSEASESFVVQPQIINGDFNLYLSIPPGGPMVVAGGATNVEVSVQSVGPGFFNGNVNLTGQVSPSVVNGPIVSFNPSQISLQPPGPPTSVIAIATVAATPPENFTVTVTGTSGALTHSVTFQLRVLPPPVLKVTPSSGVPGAQVTLQGSGFFNPPVGGISFPTQVLVTFDNQLVGFGILHGTSFNFTFNIPLSQQGLHHIHAVEQYPFSLDVQADFTVLAQPQPSNNPLSVIVTAGTIYFPGDTATIFLTTSVNGQSTTVSSLQVVLIKPNGSTLTLKADQVATGLWKATYRVPSTGAIGTYAVVVRAHQQPLDGSGLASFEVKPTWLQGHASTIVGATGVVGAIGVLAVAWRGGLLTRRKDDFPLL